MSRVANYARGLMSRGLALAIGAIAEGQIVKRSGYSLVGVSNPCAVAIATVTVGNTTSELTLLGAVSGSLTLAANSITAGHTIRIVAAGYVSYSSLTGGTFTPRLKLGSTTLTGSPLTPPSGNNQSWLAEWVITCYTAGASGTVWAQGVFRINTSSGGQGTSATVTIDTTAAQAVNLTAQWQNAGISNTITLTNFIVERLN